MPSHAGTGFGISKRSACAYGMPRKVNTSPSFKPRSFPPLTWTTGGCRFGDSEFEAALAANCVLVFGCSMADAGPRRVR